MEVEKEKAPENVGDGDGLHTEVKTTLNEELELSTPGINSEDVSEEGPSRYVIDSQRLTLPKREALKNELALLEINRPRLSLSITTKVL